MRKFLIAAFSLLLIVLFPLQSLAADSVSYKTETLSADGEVIETQTAYIPIGLFGQDVELLNPEDLFIDEMNEVYIADSGTQVVTRMSDNGEVIQVYGEGILQQPLGIFVDEEKNLYVADYAKEAVLKFDDTGELLFEYTRPESPLFGVNSPYKPQKLSVDQRGNLYIIGEGSTNGIIQLNQDGEFLGFFGVNTTRPTIGSFITDMLTTERQRASMFMRVPPAPNNITIDDRGLLYTITSGTEWEAIRQLNIAGLNMLSPDVTDRTNLRDIAIGTIGNIYTVGNDGIIYEYDSAGDLLFMFGGREDGSNRLGLSMQPSGIEVDNLGRLYVTDKEQGLVQVFEPTDFTTILHQGLALYAEGHYIESEDYWNEVLRLNSSFGLAHKALGQALYKQQLYNEAAYEFELAQDRENYSDAFWEIRYQWLQENLSLVFVLLIAFLTLRALLKFLDKRYETLRPIKEKKEAFKKQKLMSELLFLFRFLKKPLDSLYYLRVDERASILSATILYVVFVTEYLLTIYWTGFLFNTRSTEQITLFFEIGTVLVPLALFIVTNYLVSTITDGEGRFRHVYIGTIYSLAPLIIFIIPITLISNVLTYNEAFLYQFPLQIIIIWSLILLFLMIKELHDFTGMGTVRNIVVTIFGMFIMVLIFFVLYVLVDQLVDFIWSFIQEVVLRV
ncbi:YIP1 family protein [Alkalihalobacillus sp. 1P02AB]|uniref:YIP1 family protein n=1 Tax=Alkalihalobacillus sp. 1P02AB TaxID=3132260 RepID=UPI0039A5AE8F